MTRDVTDIIPNFENIIEKNFYEDSDEKAYPIYESAFKKKEFLIIFIFSGVNFIKTSGKKVLAAKTSSR